MGTVTLMGGRLRRQMLVVLPFAGVIYGALYAARRPELFGVAFFFWYEVALIPFTVLVVRFAFREPRPAPAARASLDEEPRFSRDQARVLPSERTVTRAG